MSVSVLVPTLLENAFWAAVAAMGFAILFQVPPKLLPGCMATGALGFGTRTLLMDGFDVPIEISTLTGATVIGFLGLSFSQRWQIPSLVFSVTGAIPMVPGFFAYRAMLGILRLTLENPGGDAVLLDAAVNAIHTALILGSLALGITMPRLLFRRKKPVV